MDFERHELEGLHTWFHQKQTSYTASFEGLMQSFIPADITSETYQSHRHYTHVGLEVGSLVAGGYGAVKGIAGFAKLARIPVQITKIAKFSGQLKWPSPTKGRSLVNGIEYTTHALERMAPRGLIQSGTEIISRGVPP